MSKHSTVVLWLGLAMIFLNLAKSWKVVKGVVFAGAATPGKPGGKPVKGKCPSGLTLDPVTGKCVQTLQ
jgi:hypothetical protein